MWEHARPSGAGNPAGSGGGRLGPLHFRYQSPDRIPDLIPDPIIRLSPADFSLHNFSRGRSSDYLDESGNLESLISIITRALIFSILGGVLDDNGNVRRVMRNITCALIFQNVRGDLDENGHVKDEKNTCALLCSTNSS